MTYAAFCGSTSTRRRGFPAAGRRASASSRTQHLASRRRPAAPRRSLLHQHGRAAGVRQQVGEALRRVRGVERHVRAAGLEHGQQRHDQLRRALQRTRPRAPPGPRRGARSWCASRLARALQLGVGERRRPRRRRHGASGVRAACSANSSCTQACGKSAARGVPGLQHLRALRAAQQRHLRETRAAGRPPWPPAAPPGARPCARSSPPRTAPRGRPASPPSASASSASASSRSNLATPAPPPNGSSSRLAQRQPRRPRRTGLRAKVTWKTGACVRLRSTRQLLHQPLEGQLLVVVRPQRRLPHPPQQLGPGGVARQVGAQGEHVDEEADQPLRLRAGCAPRWGCPPPRPPAPRSGQQRLPAGQQRHEQRRALAPRERPQLPRQLRREGEAVAPRARALPRPRAGGPWGSPAAAARRPARSLQ